MKNKNDILNFLSQHQNTLMQEFHISQLGLFGSFARSEQTELSDIDLLVEFEEGISKTYTLKKKLISYLRELLGRDVDIASQKFLKPYAKEQILKETIRVF